MLPMNKLMEDVIGFVKNREAEVMGAPACSEDVLKQMAIRLFCTSGTVAREQVVLFANEMSDKYEEHVSVELVDTLVTSYQDSVDKLNNERREEGATEENPVKDLLDNIDDGVDLDTKGA